MTEIDTKDQGRPSISSSVEVRPDNKVVDGGSIDVRRERGGLEVACGADLNLIEVKITLDGSRSCG
jgi:hypothetical protein